MYKKTPVLIGGIFCQRSAYLQGGCLCINDASAPVKQTTVLAFCVPVYMPADTGNTTGSESGQAMGGDAAKMEVPGFIFIGGHKG